VNQQIVSTEMMYRAATVELTGDRRAFRCLFCWFLAASFCIAWHHSSKK